MNVDVTMNANLQGAAVSARQTSGVAREWRLASRTVRFSASCLALFYLLAAASPFFASYDPTYQNREMPDCPPMALRMRAPSDWSHGVFYTFPTHMQDKVARTFAADPSRRLDMHLFTRGHRCTPDSEREPYFMLGSDGLGRDLYSRIVYGSRVSMCVGLIGVLISFSLGITIGALAAVIPSGMSTVATFFMIVAIMSFISWAGFARIIRGMASSVRSRPYVEAARALGASRWRIITRHIIPSVIGYAIVAATLSIPGFILGESALSLLGLGIQEPAASWGNLLAQAQDVQNLARYPWILIPGIFIFL